MLLSQTDPAPVEIEDGRPGTLVITCEHAGRSVPAGLADLGIAQADMDDHIGWDPGARAVARRLAARFHAPLVAQRYSRLVIDCNRPWGAPDLAASVADGRQVPGNAGLDESGLRLRWNEIHRPFHAAISPLAARAAGLVSVHSFTPRRRGDAMERPWQLGVVARVRNALSCRLLQALDRVLPGRVALNEPYEIEDASDFTIPVHAEPAGLPHVLLEIRSDAIDCAVGADRVAQIIGDALAEARA